MTVSHCQMIFHHGDVQSRHDLSIRGSMARFYWSEASRISLSSNRTWPACSLCVSRMLLSSCSDKRLLTFLALSRATCLSVTDACGSASVSDVDIGSWINRKSQSAKVVKMVNAVD